MCASPFAERHERLWEWFHALAPKKLVEPRVEIWPRGGAKSTSGELGVVWCGVKLSRRFVLYVSATQDQANKHVASISNWMEQVGIERAVNSYGNSKGWTVNVLRTANGFNVVALGLDAANRGVKLDQYRPDLIIFDDIDNQDDTLKTVDKKIKTITTSILPTGSPDCAALFLQNKIHKNGVVAQLSDGRADFLHDRQPAFEEPAVFDLRVESQLQEDGRKKYVIVAGNPSWLGQPLDACERQINLWGYKAFRREAQHEVADADGIFFRVANVGLVEADEVPELSNCCLAGDLAATEGGGDYTALALIGTDGARYFVLAVLRGQWSSERVRQVINLARTFYRPIFKRFSMHLPQDGGQAGRDQADRFRDKYPGAKVEPVGGSKATRATDFAEAVNLGNVYLVNQDLPEIFSPFIEDRRASRWHQQFLTELGDFREDVLDQVDDQVDAASDSFTEIESGHEPLTTSALRTGLVEREASVIPGMGTRTAEVPIDAGGVIMAPVRRRR